MQHKPRPISVNLLPQDPFYETLPGRILSWASTIGRYLVIFTEIVVIMSFATRFKLDRDLTDLNTLLVQKSALIESYGTLESDVRKIQDKTGFIETEAQQTSPAGIMTIVERMVPQLVVLEVLQITQQHVILTGNAPTSTELAMLIVSLQRDGHFSEVTVSQVNSHEEGNPGFEFTIQAKYAQEEPQQPAAGSSTEENVAL